MHNYPFNLYPENWFEGYPVKSKYTRICELDCWTNQVHFEELAAPKMMFVEIWFDSYIPLFFSYFPCFKTVNVKFYWALVFKIKFPKKSPPQDLIFKKDFGSC